MTWPTFAFAGAAIGLWVWGSYWRDRAQRLARERDLHRRIARRAQTAAVEGERRFRDPSRVITSRDYADLLDALVERDGEDRDLTLATPPVRHDPRRGTLWGQPILPSPGETVTDGQTTHRCVPPFLRPGETWTCDTCQMTWGAGEPSEPGGAYWVTDHR